MNSFKDKVVVITGGATGIGFSFAKRFGEEGARIVIAGLGPDLLEKAVQQLTALGVEAIRFQCDVTNKAEVEALADFAWDQMGRVDVIVNNAGVAQKFSSVIDTPPEEARRVHDVNFFGVWNGVSVFGKRFIAQRSHAAIYNLGSENSLFDGFPFSAAYVSSKHAVLAITDALRKEVPDFIDVGLICPGFVRSELGEYMDAGMDTDRFTSMAMEQIKNGDFFIVSHAYNMVPIAERYREISNAFKRSAPRYSGDVEFDVRTMIARMPRQDSTEG